MSSDLERRLDRLSRLLVDEVKSWDRSEERRRMEASRDERRPDELLALQDSRLGRKMERRENKRMRRAIRRAEQREKERENASIGVGVVMVGAALVLMLMALLHPELWWLVFPGLGIGSGGVRNVAYALDARRQERSELPPVGVGVGVGGAVPQPLVPASSTKHEVDVLCDDLLRELAESPEPVRAFLQNPERTVESLRQTCKALDARRQQLVAQDARGQRVALAQRQEELQRKHDAAGDPTARQKLGQALTSMGQQGAALDQLAAMTERVDGEYTSLLVLLQEMRTRVTVARSAGGAVQIDALAQNVQRLNTELEAITNAVEDVSRGEQPAIDPLAAGGSLGTPGDKSKLR